MTINIAQTNDVAQTQNTFRNWDVSRTRAEDWGIADGLNGESEFTGYEYFTGKALAAYRKGWAAGNALRVLAAAPVAEPAPMVDGIIDEREIGGVNFALRSKATGWVIEESILGDFYESEVYTDFAEAQFAFEVATGRQVAQFQDYGADYGDGEAIGYAESTRPWEF